MPGKVLGGVVSAARAGALVVALALVPATARAGPPYVTDDPEPVEPHHWEFYLASQDELAHDGDAGTAPHVEINYGAVANLQLHLVVPLAWSRPPGGPAVFGPGDVELGAKLRLVQEGPGVPMVGVFPLLELPAGDESRGLGSGRPHALLPVWLQKSRGPWTTYGGGGWWINPGPGNRDYWLAGWLVQRRLSRLATPGAELFATTPDRDGGRAGLRYDVGCELDFGDRHHVLLSAGHSLAGDRASQVYLAWQLTI